MAQPETLAKVKQAIRRSHDKLDDDLKADIDACLADLRAHGINGPQAVETDPLIYNAIKLYVRASYTDDPVKGAEYLRRYDALKACLMMAEGYGYEEADSDG